MGYIRLDKNAFFNNLDYFSSICKKSKLSIALKDNAYGHGIYEIGLLCQEYGIKHVFVRDIREANIAKKFNFETILVLYDIPLEKDDQLFISINSIDDIKKVPKKSKIELKLDTGMNRNGLTKSELFEVFQIINTKTLDLKGVFTHFCCADENNNITKKQEQKFQDMLEIIKSNIKYDFRIHCANTDSVNILNNNLYDIARLGIGIYGYNKIQQKYLKPVMSLWANKISTRVLNKGDKIGYGATYTIKNDNMIVSNYDLGYANGLFRANERKKFKISNEKEILGRISMDSFSIFGDDKEVCVFDNVTDIAKIFDTIEYEIFTHLKDNIVRKYAIGAKH